MGMGKRPPSHRPHRSTLSKNSPTPKRRWFRFSLKTLLIVVVLSSLLLGWLGLEIQQAERQSQAVEEIQKTGAWVVYDWDLDDDGNATWKGRPPVPEWLTEWTGVDLFGDVVGVTFGQVTDAQLEHVKTLTDLRWLDLHDTQVTDAGLEHLKRLTNLHKLWLWGTQITDAGLEYVKGFTTLQSLALGDTQVTDAGLDHLKGLTKLETLNLSGTQITDVGLQHLKGLTNLKWLNLANTQITDVGLEHLEELTNVQELYLSGTQVTGSGIEELRKSLPNCRIVRYDTNGRPAQDKP